MSRDVDTSVQYLEKWRNYWRLCCCLDHSVLLVRDIYYPKETNFLKMGTFGIYKCNFYLSHTEDLSNCSVLEGTNLALGKPVVAVEWQVSRSCVDNVLKHPLHFSF